MLGIENSLRNELRDPEYSEGYAESFLHMFIATQIKVVREQRGMTQAELGFHIGTTQAGVSRLEDVNYKSWNIRTLIKLARAFNVRLKVSFEPYGTLPDEVIRFDRTSLERCERKDDPGLRSSNVPLNLGNLLPFPSKSASLSGLEESMPWMDAQKGGQGYGETRSANG